MRRHRNDFGELAVSELSVCYALNRMYIESDKVREMMKGNHIVSQLSNFKYTDIFDATPANPTNLSLILPLITL